MSIEIVAQGLIVGEYGTIRRTENGMISAFDLIRVCGEGMDRSYPRKTLENIKKEYSEVGNKIHYFKFVGRGQRETPIVDKETALQILGLLPGIAGKKYREFAANLVSSFLENPDQVAKAAIDRIKGKKELEEVTNKALNKYISTYHPLMGEIRKRDGVSPVTYQHVNTVNTKAIMGKEPHLVKAERGGKTARENATSDELMHLYVLQSIQQKGLQNRNAKGHSEISRTIQEVADDFQNLLGKYGVNLQQLG